MRNVLVFAAVVVACSCSKSTDGKPAPASPTEAAPSDVAPAPIENATPVATEPPADAPACAAAVDQAVALVGGGAQPDWFEHDDDPPDLDGDGRADIVLVGHGSRNAEHYFFVLRGGCAELAGVITASIVMGYGCRAEQTNGLCDLHIGRMMVHGETEHSTYKFDGTRYEMHGRPELGPRPPKFK